MFINKQCPYCDSRHDTYSELVNYFSSSLWLFPESTPSFSDLVDNLECCSGCRFWFNTRFDLIGDYYEKKKNEKKNAVSSR